MCYRLQQMVFDLDEVAQKKKKKDSILKTRRIQNHNVLH